MATRHGSARVTLPSDTEILITRDFEASPERVWAAMTTPHHLLRWWGPDWHPLVSCEVDLREGGRWRFVSRGVDGDELAWHGRYREVVPPERLVSTEVFEGNPQAPVVTITTLSHADGITTVRTLVQHTSTQARDNHVHSGMESGLQGSYNRLDDVLATPETAADRFRRVAGRFGDRVREVSPRAWQNPAPCAGWTTRDVVVHLVEWVPSVIGRAGVSFEGMPVATEDPVGAWEELARRLQEALEDEEVAGRSFDVGPPGQMQVAQAIDMLVTPDVLVHTWDLARAAGLDERIDADLAAQALAGMEPMDQALRDSGHYGPRVPVAAEASVQTRLLAFTGRQV